MIRSGTWAIIRPSVLGIELAGSPRRRRGAETSRKRGDSVAAFKSDKERTEELVAYTSDIASSWLDSVSRVTV